MKIIIYLASSVNGMISNKKGVPDWLSQEYMDGFASVCQETQAVIMGKTTYDILAPDYLPLKNEGTMIVLTHNTDQPGQPNLIFTDKGPEHIVSLLRDRGHTEAVIIGGTMTVSQFLRAGLVDELRLVIEPALFGMGLPLLKDVDGDYQLILSDVRRLNENSVQVWYQLKK